MDGVKRIIRDWIRLDEGDNFVSREIVVATHYSLAQHRIARNAIRDWLSMNASSLFGEEVSIGTHTVIFYDNDDATLFRLWLV